MIQLAIRELKLFRSMFYLFFPILIWGLFYFTGFDSGKLSSLFFILLVSCFWAITSSSLSLDYKGSRLLIQSLPVSRTEIVLSRFFVSVPFIMIAYFINSLVVFIKYLGLWERSNYTIPNLLELVTIISLHFMFVTIYHVTNYFFNRQVVNFIFVFFTMFFINMMFVILGGFNVQINDFLSNPTIVSGLLFIAFIITVVCYFLSRIIYEKRRS